MSQGTAWGVLVGYIVVGVIALVLHIWLSHVIAKAAERRNRSYWAFFWLSFFVSWIIMGIIVATLPSPSNGPEGVAPGPSQSPRDAQKAASQSTLTKDAYVKCPYCAEEIRAEANICRFCRSDVSSQRAEREAIQEQQQVQEQLNAKSERVSWSARRDRLKKIPAAFEIVEILDEGRLVLKINQSENERLSQGELNFLFFIQRDVLDIPLNRMPAGLDSEIKTRIAAVSSEPILDPRGNELLTVDVDHEQGSDQYLVTITAADGYFL